MPTVKNPFNYRFSNGNHVRVPAGAKVAPIPGEPGRFWVDPGTFTSSLDRHDATYYGVRVEADNVEEDKNNGG